MFTVIKTKLTTGAYSKISCKFRDFPKWIQISTDQNIVPSNGSRLPIIKKWINRLVIWESQTLLTVHPS